MLNPAPSVPEGHRIYAIGDVHGCLDLLKRLMSKITDDAAQHPSATKEIIFLGDYIDRGLGSRQTIDYLINNIPDGMKPVFLRGNHEDILMRIMDGDIGLMQAWLQFGGVATLASYGIATPRSKSAMDPQVIRADLHQKVPSSHIDFYRNSEVFCVRGDYYFTHAGIRPGLPLELQSAEDLMWIREPFLNSEEDFGKVIVHGHTISLEAEIMPNRIGIDTGAYATGKLTCLVLQGTERLFLTT